jgi:hypothetical protein
MIACPVGSKPQSPPVQQFKEARYVMLSRKFSDYEKEIKTHLDGMLGSTGFAQGGPCGVHA